MRSNASLMSCVQSSGSIDSASVVEPTMSAKSAVTGLRSPVSLALRILSTSGAGAAAANRDWRASADESGSSDCPQLMQKRASAGTGASQRGHVSPTDSTDICCDLTTLAGTHWERGFRLLFRHAGTHLRRGRRGYSLHARGGGPPALSRLLCRAR